MLRSIYRAVVPQKIREGIRLGSRLQNMLAPVNNMLIPVKIALSLPLKKTLTKIQFEIHLAEHCNLNCAGCDHFSSIAEPELVSVEEFTRDMKRMGELFGHDCTRIYLIGGEPLLHPDIITLMKITRENFTSGDITIYTNGILLPQKGADFWQACHDNNIGILISSYPIKLDKDKINDAAKKFAVRISWGFAPKNALKESTFIVSPIDISGKGDPKKSFARCLESNACITLKHGKLFTCVFAAHVHHFSKKFGIDIPITEADCIDIYKESDGNEILKKLNRPIPACRFCSGGAFTKSSRKMKWHRTEQDINEWL